METFEFKQRSDLLNLKASRFNALNRQIKSKMIFQKLRKVLKRDKVGAQDLYLNLQKKYYLYNVFSAIRYYPMQIRREQRLVNACVLAMKAMSGTEKKECGDFYARKLAYKVLYVIKRNRREKVEKRIFNKVA